MLRRCTNEMVERLQKISQDKTLDEALIILNKESKYAKWTKEELKEAAERYLIKFVDVDDMGIFKSWEYEAIKKLSKTCNDIKELYNIFSGMYPNKCDYKTFIVEISKLSFMKAYDIREEFGGFTRLEKLYVDEILKNENDNTAVYAEFNKAFPNKYFYIQFVSILNDYKMLKIPKKPKKEYGGRNKLEKTVKVLEILHKAAEEHKDNSLTINEYLELVNKEYPNVTYKGLHAIIKRNDIPYTKVIKKGAKVSSPVQRGVYNRIYDEVVSLIEQNTLKDTIKELEKRHPEFKGKMTVNNLRQFAMRKGLTYIKGKKGKPAKTVKEPVVVDKPKRNMKRKDSSLFADKVYERLKELAPDYTKTECGIIINEEFGTNFSKAYVYDISKTRGQLQFKEYTEFTQEMKDFVLEKVRLGILGRELHKEFIDKFPNKFVASTFYKCLQDLLIETEKKDKVSVQEEVEPVEIQEEVAETEEATEPQEVQEQEVPRHIQIIEEVNTVFERKCKQLGRTGDTHTHTDKLINALDILVKYAKEKNDLVRLANDHEDILEQYRREVEHEIELQPFSETDTYCQNKLKAIAMRRREVKYVRDDLTIMSTLLKTISDNITAFEKTAEAMKHRVSQRENSIFIPLVDYTMVKKYDWCRSATLTDKKAYTPILKTNARIDRINTSKSDGRRNIWTEKEEPKIQNTDQIGKPNNHKVSTYRVKAEFLALKGNPFVNRYYDVRATNEDAARELGKEYFDLISANNDKAQYQITDIYKLNR